MRVRIGMYDRETVYIKRLAANIRQLCREDADIMTFTRRETFLEGAAQGSFDLALCPPPEAEELGRSGNVKAAVLSEDIYENRVSADGRVYICKYQSSQNVWKGLVAGFEQLQHSGIRPGADQGARFYAVLSPHGCGAGTGELFGLALGQIFCEDQRERPLFLTLEEFSALAGEQTEPSSGEDISGLYYLFSRGQLSEAAVRAAVFRWGDVDYIKPAGLPGDLFPEGKVYEAEFFTELARLGGYGCMVTAMGGSVYGKEGLLSMCEKVYLLHGGGRGQAQTAQRVAVWGADAAVGMNIQELLLPADIPSAGMYSTALIEKVRAVTLQDRS